MFIVIRYMVAFLSVQFFMISQVKNNLFYDHKYYHYMAASFNVLFKKTVEVNNTIWIITYIFRFINFYPGKTAFTDQYSLPNIFFYIGQL